MLEAGPEKKIGKYIIIKRLGRGGMGYVYHAYDPLIKRDVAIKIIHPDMAEDHMLIERFKREAQSAGGLRHPNIVTIYDLGEDNDRPYIAMEFLEGTDLEQLIRNKADILLEKKLDVIIQVCDGLDYAHKHGIVHRDITPSNIRILDNGLVKIMDFGIAKITSQQITQTGTLMGKPHYMAPEQVRGEGIDGRTDIFALGVCLYEFLCYRKPFPGENTTSVLLKIISNEPEPLTDIHYVANPHLESIIFKALEKDASKRFQTANEMAEALKEFIPTTKVTKLTGTIPTEVQETLLTPPKIDMKTPIKQAAKTEAPVQTIQTLPTLQKEPTSAPQKEISTRLSTPAAGPKAEPTVSPTKLLSPGTDAYLDSTEMPTTLTTPAAGSKLDANIPNQGSTVLSQPAAPPIKITTQITAPPKSSSKIILIAFAAIIIAAASGIFYYKYYMVPQSKTGSSTENPISTNQTNQNNLTNQTNTTTQNNQSTQTTQTTQNNQLTQNNQTTAIIKPQKPGFLKLNVLPWAKIVKINNKTTNQTKFPEDLYTPCLITLEPGNYSMVVNNVELNKDQSITFNITASEVTVLNYKFQLISSFKDEDFTREQ